MGRIEGMQQSTLYVDPKVYEMIRMIALRRGVPAYQIVNEAFRNLIEKVLTPAEQKVFRYEKEKASKATKEKKTTRKAKAKKKSKSTKGSGASSANGTRGRKAKGGKGRKEKSRAAANGTNGGAGQDPQT